MALGFYKRRKISQIKMWRAMPLMVLERGFLRWLRHVTRLDSRRHQQVTRYVHRDGMDRGPRHTPTGDCHMKPYVFVYYSNNNIMGAFIKKWNVMGIFNIIAPKRNLAIFLRLYIAHTHGHLLFFELTRCTPWSFPCKKREKDLLYIKLVLVRYFIMLFSKLSWIKYR